jgi:hypothetical protein
MWINRNCGDVLIQKCQFEEITSTEYNGALWIDRIGGTVFIDKCKFEDNINDITWQTGGNVVVSNVLQDVTIQKSDFKRNIYLSVEVSTCE